MQKRVHPFGKTQKLKPKTLFGLTLKTTDEIADEHNKWFEYDSDGDIVQEKVIIDGITYTKEYQYDSNKNIIGSTQWIKR